MSRNHHLICLPHHAAKIIDGTKTTTIRAPRKHAVAVGDTITFAKWKGRPYWSEQERVCVVKVTSVRNLAVCRKSLGVYIGGVRLREFEAYQVAVNDGFADTLELIDYLASPKRPKFSGFIYGWVKNTPVAFGLDAQGHLPTIEKMLADKKTWAEIAKEIGWEEITLRSHYQLHIGDKSTRPGSGNA